MEVNLTETDVAYIAELLDGEGSFNMGKCYTKNPKHCAKRGFNWEIRISVGMCDTQALEFVKHKYKKKTNLRPTKSTKGHRTCYFITLYSGEIRRTIDKIIPYLKVKKQQGILIREAINIIGTRSTPKVDKRLGEIRHKISYLNNPTRVIYGAAVKSGRV